ncbi:molybdate ABC transporter substrate-binding protein [Shewanella sp. NIFS-20-20]|uniref:molybdate ABC transporter substrate-binding protein n=1 Tax=Shewanella sp. NIFS-20-20 TaxID=2853806 RepID=UPI001C45D90A|nr:molybdate ABC transporter substrate-binding protein [Shewanella sp. NIFS-20-20]MBV7316085.1 molybdate ABC transporter substrate-binding protein [Shewanella sp. NIFS-20-20]
MGQWRRWVTRYQLGVLLVSLWLMTASAWAQPPAIAAAANIKFALDDIAAQFQQDTGKRVRISYGSSGNFVAQIRHGAPFELFLSADEKYLQQLASAGVALTPPQLYARGKLALVTPKASQIQLDPQLDGIKQALDKGQISRFTIANPEHAPYGERAQELLERRGLWHSVTPYLILGENASQAAQFAISGSTQAGIVALSLAKAPQFAARANILELPEQDHQPLAQYMSLLPHAGATATEFYQYIQSPAAQAIFQDYGFAVPPPQVP